jgi:hypothetical protein
MLSAKFLDFNISGLHHVASITTTFGVAVNRNSNKNSNKNNNKIVIK